MKYSSTVRLINVILFVALGIGFGFLGIYFGFLVTPFLWLKTGPIELPTMSFGLAAMLGVTGLAGLIVSAYGLFNSVLSLLREKDDRLVRRSFGCFIAIGYLAALFFLINATWLYRLTSTNIGYDEFGFVIVVYSVLAIISLLVSNIPLVRMYGEGEELNSIMKIIDGTLFASTLAVALVFLSSYIMVVTGNGVYQQAAVANQMLVGFLLSLGAALLSGVAFVGYAIADKTGSIKKINGFLFEGSLCVTGGLILSAGIFEYLSQSKKTPDDVSLVARAIHSTNGAYMEFSVMAFILGGLLILASLAFARSTLKGSGDKKLSAPLN